MTPVVFLADLIRQGFMLREEGGKLIVAPSSKLTPEQIALIKEHKAAIIELLATEEEWEESTTAIAERAALDNPFRGPAQSDGTGTQRAPASGGVPHGGDASVFRQKVGSAGNRDEGLQREVPGGSKGGAKAEKEGRKEAEAPGSGPDGAGHVEHVGWCRCAQGNWTALCRHPDRWEAWRILLAMRPGMDETNIELLVNTGGHPDHRKKPR